MVRTYHMSLDDFDEWLLYNEPGDREIAERFKHLNDEVDDDEH